MPAYVNPSTSFFDKSFSETLIESYILSVQLSLYGLIFSVYNPDKNRFIVLESFRFVGLKNTYQIANELDAVIDHHKWLNQPFKEINFIFTDTICTTIPSALFLDTEKETYLNFNQSVVENSIILHNNIKNAGVVQVFSLPDSLNNKLKSIWPKVNIFHFSSILLDSILNNFKNKADNNTIFMQVHKDYIELVYLKNGKLFFHNLFKYKSKEDFIYFLLAAIEQLKLNPEVVKLILIGEIQKSSIYYDMVYQYIRHIEFIAKNDTFNYTYLLDKLDHHQFYVLFNVLQCE